MDIKKLLFIILIINSCLQNEIFQKDGEIGTFREIKDKSISKKAQLRHLINSPFTDLFINLIKYCSYGCFIAFAFWCVLVFISGDKNNNDKNAIEDIYAGAKLQAIYLFKTKQ